MLNYDKHKDGDDFIGNLSSLSPFPYIDRLPTGITSHSAFLIDNIFTNNITSSSHINNNSHHLTIFNLIAHKIKRSKKEYIFVGKMSKDSTSLLKERHISSSEETSSWRVTPMRYMTASWIPMSDHIMSAALCRKFV